MKSFYVGIKGICIYNNAVLLLKRHKHNTYFWDAPGGRIDEQESIEEALTRELKEEVGVIKAIVGNQLTVYQLPNDVENDHALLLIFYLVRLKTKNVVLSGEHEDFKWIPLTTIETFFRSESDHVNEGTKSAIRQVKY